MIKALNVFIGDLLQHFHIVRNQNNKCVQLCSASSTVMEIKLPSQQCTTSRNKINAKVKNGSNNENCSQEVEILNLLFEFDRVFLLYYLWKSFQNYFMHQRFSIFTFIRKILNSLQVIILIVKILVQRSSQSVKYKKIDMLEQNKITLLWRQEHQIYCGTCL